MPRNHQHVAEPTLAEESYAEAAVAGVPGLDAKLAR